MGLQLVHVNTKELRKIFIDYIHTLYEGDSCYVPDLYQAMKEHFDEKKNPFFKQATVALYLVQDHNKTVGRIACIYNPNYNKYHNCNVSFFGFFDCIDDQKVADLLLNKAREFGQQYNATALIGPVNFSTNDTAGLLIDGFDTPPVIQMTYNYPYYQKLIENNGFVKDMDLFAYWIPTSEVNQKSVLLTDRIKQRLASKGIGFRHISLKNFKEEVKAVKAIYRSAWEKNWGFFPPTDEEFDFLAVGLKLLLDEKYGYICEHNGKVVGFAVALPNINEITINFKKGRLFPFNIFKLLLNKSKTKAVRVMLLGVIEDYRKLGIEAVFFGQLIKMAQENNLAGGEASWILENNEMMVKGAENLNGKKYKTYRIFTKKI